MAIDLTLNSQTLTYGNRANSAPNKPTSLGAGDFILSTLYIESSTAVTVPTGHTLLGSQQHTSGNNFWIYVAGKIATGGEGATIAWAHATADTTAWHLRVTGVDSTTFQDPATPVGTQGTGATPLSNTGITTLLANTAIGMVSGTWNAVSYSASTLTERIDFGGETGLFATVQAGAGASGTKTATPSAAVDYVTLVFGLREASAAAAIFPPFPPPQRIIVY